MKVQTETLTGTALDWAVAVCECYTDPVPETTWEDVKDLAVPFSMWEINYDSSGVYWHSPITVSRCGVDETVGATEPSIWATAENGRKFRGSIRDYFLTARDAAQECRRCQYGDLSNPGKFSTDWSLAGPIIERVASNLFKHNGGSEWCCAINAQREGYTAIITADGPTPIIAAMRCYVSSKLGAEVEIPDELASLT